MCTEKSGGWRDGDGYSVLVINSGWQAGTVTTAMTLTGEWEYVPETRI